MQDGIDREFYAREKYVQQFGEVEEVGFVADTAVPLTVITDTDRVLPKAALSVSLTCAAAQSLIKSIVNVPDCRPATNLYAVS